MINNYSKSRHITIDKDNRRFKLNNVVVPEKKSWNSYKNCFSSNDRWTFTINS